MDMALPSTSTGSSSVDSPWSGELAESFMTLPSGSMSKRTEGFVSAMTDTRLSAAENCATSILTDVLQLGGRSCL